MYESIVEVCDNIHVYKVGRVERWNINIEIQIFIET